jgi:protein O-mannosyl-transferase
LVASATAAAKQATVVSRPLQPAFIPRDRRSTVLCLLLLVLTLSFYAGVIRNGFTNIDDDLYVTNNVHVQAGLTWDTVKWAFASRDAANWHPVTWLSHALDCQMFGLNPVGPHTVTLLLHAVNAVLLFLLLESATGFTWPSFMVAALFALHPVNVESVAWAAERKNVLSMLFFLLTLLAYGWYARRASLRRYTVVAALFALGLMAKPEIITLPFVLLLWDYWPLQRLSVFGSKLPVRGEGAGEDPITDAVVPRSFSFLLMEKAPLLLLSAGSAAITLVAQSAGNALQPMALRLRLENAVVAYVRYVGKAFWPVRLAALYPHPGSFLPGWEIAASVAVLVGVTAVVVAKRDHRYLAVGWFWFLGTLVPVIGIVQVGVQAMADRYAYLSFIGLFVGVVWGIAEPVREKKIPAAWLAALAVLILLVLGILTRRQVSYWHDSETLWRHALNVTDGNYAAHGHLARALARQGRTADAMVEFNNAESLHSYSSGEMVAVGIFAQTHGHVPDAIEQYRRALNAAPDANSRAVAMSWMGAAFTQMGDIVRARASYANALAQNPDDGPALVGSGLLAERDGDLANAVEQISHAMKVQPNDVGYLLLEQALRRAGRMAEASDAGVRAQEISSNFPRAQRAAAQVLASAGISPE